MAAPARSPRQPAPARRAAPKPRRARGPGLMRAPAALLAGFHWRRWLAVMICVAVLLIGVPLAHALVGDLGALLLLVGVGGFALGRATAPRAAPAAAPRHGRGRG
ncbi:hypothetical protein [Teichococcus oryzae]|uniref:Uncharacterized protein n=1 Tax=Teichococcus oryzae TaxID=1608942 RepID=A0A5B2TJV2_9PROT|nr:hypothetical protein [Pseudoroseomonas oryzae]KAA2214752.1 hypothetical protein F0Q34_03420 [Pseudoroseomonas oryzae]